MTRIVIRLEGDGIKRLARAADKLGKRGQLEMKRGFISGGRKTTTRVKKAMVAQTGIKAHAVSRRTKGYFDAASNAWVITGQGKGVTLDEVKGTRARRYTPRDPSNQPRDARGRFAEWPQDKRLAAGLVSANVWNNPRRFAYSYRDGEQFVSNPPDKPRNILYGPAPYKEIVKGPSVAAWRHGAADIQREIERRIRKASDGVMF